MNRLITLAGLALLAGTAVPAMAQDGTAATQPSIYDGDNVTVGVGALYMPSYEGSDDQVLSAAPMLRGSLSGFNFITPGAGLQVDLIREAKGARTDFQLGPVVKLNFNRTRQIKDPVVKRLGELDMAVEVGGVVVVRQSGVLNPYDGLGASVTVRNDVAGVSDGLVINPVVSYTTPLSRGIFAAAALSANHVDDKYMRTYFGVTPAGAAASGLPVYTPKGGWKDVNATLMALFDLSGDLTDGGLGLGVMANYGRIVGPAADSPIVRDRGSRDQWTGAVGITYTF